jgi:predicted TIM-barrel fold metal-dependent hydrolase
MIVFDADGHVEESQTTFSFLEKEYFERRPLALGFDSNTVYGSHNAIWFIDGEVYPKVLGKGGFTFKTPTLMEGAKEKPFSIGAQELTDVEARLKDLDRAEIDKQVVYPTLFLTTTTDDVKFEAALFRSYNSFMADACSKSGGRIRFAALVPIRDIDESIRELGRAKRLGAASVMLLGVAWDKCLGDETLYPFYEEAAKLDIPVCIHFGWGCPAVTSAFESHQSFYSAVLPVLMGFHSLMCSGVLDTLPKLRFAFLETGSFWAPYVIHQLRRSRRARCAKDPAQYFKDGRIYIACEADEDINYLTELIGEDCLVVASDYPHLDASHEESMKQAVMRREDVPLRVREKILSANPQRLYSI